MTALLVAEQDGDGVVLWGRRLVQTEAYARELIAYHASITLGVNVEASVALRGPHRLTP